MRLPRRSALSLVTLAGTGLCSASSLRQPSRALVRSLLSTLLLAVSAAAVTPQKPPIILRNGELVDLRGTLVLEHRGWNHFLVLRTANQYALVPDALTATLPVPRAVTTEFGITLRGQDDRLARSLGRTVRVSGRLQFNPGSTVLWHGTLIQATVVAMPGGDYLDVKPPEPGLSLAVRRYTATATLDPKTWPRTYTARDLDTRRPLLTPDLAGCRVAPTGDVLNCFCTDGFRPSAGSLHTARGTVAATLTGPAARFAIGEPADTAITAELECTRTAPPP